MRTFAAAVISALVGSMALYFGTDGLRAFTAEKARRVQVAEHPQTIPEVMLENQAGEAVSLHELRGQLVVVTFFYSSCRVMCPLLGVYMSEVRNQVRAMEGGHDVHFVSMSFDPERDTPKRLQAYGSRYGAESEDWWIARPREKLDRLLEAFGVVAIPHDGEFTHNAAMYLLDRGGELVGIYDWDDPRQLTAALRERV